MLGAPTVTCKEKAPDPSAAPVAASPPLQLERVCKRTEAPASAVPDTTGRVLSSGVSGSVVVRIGRSGGMSSCT